MVIPESLVENEETCVGWRGDDEGSHVWEMLHGLGIKEPTPPPPPFPSFVDSNFSLATYV